jgi:succinate dehydrogenase / fumarate reductase cytochrome b subunit
MSDRPDPSTNLEQRALRPWLGVVPLGMFAVFHLWVVYPAVHSRDAWIERAATFRLGRAGWALAVALLVLHFALSGYNLHLRRRKRGRDAAARDPWLGFEALVLALFAGFVALHVSALGLPVAAGAVGAAAAYDVLWATLGTPVQLCVYAVGLTAFAFHLGLGLVHALQAQLGSARVARYLAGGLAFFLWLSFAQVFGRLATGESLVPALVVQPSGQAPSGAP